MKIIPLLVLVLFSTLFETLSVQALPPQASAHNQQSRLKDSDKKPTKYSDLPATGEFQNQSSELPSDQARRVVRESRYKNTYPEITDPATSGTEPGEDAVMTINDWAVPLEAFPVAPSAAIVVGTVLSGKAFVSKDRTYVYSDYQVRVENNGEGFPAIGSQYLFFLGKPNFPQHEYEQIIGSLYQLRDGKVHPLDTEQLPLFDDMTDVVFLYKVEQAIKAQTGGKS
jgi:hypothetical protein